MQNSDKFDYLSSEKLEELKKLLKKYKIGKRDDFEEYKLYGLNKDEINIVKKNNAI